MVAVAMASGFRLALKPRMVVIVGDGEVWANERRGAYCCIVETQ